MTILDKEIAEMTRNNLLSADITAVSPEWAEWRGEKEPSNPVEMFLGIIGNDPKKNKTGFTIEMMEMLNEVCE